jgi:hypothetical protein
MKSFTMMLAFVFVLTGFLVGPQVSHAGGILNVCVILGPICTPDVDDPGVNPEICLQTDVDSKSQIVFLMACQGVDDHICYKQVVLTGGSTKDKDCIDCDEKCEGKPPEKLSQCLTECANKNEGCIGTQAILTWTEVGEMSCVVGIPEIILP